MRRTWSFAQSLIVPANLANALRVTKKIRSFERYLRPAQVRLRSRLAASHSQTKEALQESRLEKLRPTRRWSSNTSKPILVYPSKTTLGQYIKCTYDIQSIDGVLQWRYGKNAKFKKITVREYHCDDNHTQTYKCLACLMNCTEQPLE